MSCRRGTAEELHIKLLREFLFLRTIRLSINQTYSRREVLHANYYCATLKVCTQKFVANPLTPCFTMYNAHLIQNGDTSTQWRPLILYVLLKHPPFKCISEPSSSYNSHYLCKKACNITEEQYLSLHDPSWMFCSLVDTELEPPKNQCKTKDSKK